MKNERLKNYIVSILIPVVSGALVGLLTRGCMADFESLRQPPLSPPGWLFPVAWTLLYAAMATAMWFVLRAQGDDRFILLGLYIAQLAVNLTWPYLFFVQHAFGLAFFWLLLLWCLAGIMLHQFFRESRIAGWLLIPYQLWLTFAAVLNFFIARLNP